MTNYYPNRLCKCNCGKRIKILRLHLYNGIPQYLPGHNRRGAIVSEKTRQKLRLSNLGKHSKDKLPNCKRGPKRVAHKSLRDKLTDKFYKENEPKYYKDRICKCGCGKRIKVQPWHKYNGIPECIHHHCTKETKLQMSLNRKGKKNVFFGKKHSTKSKEKMRLSSLGKSSGKRNPMYGIRLFGKNNPFFGKHHTKESRLKNSLAHIGLQSGKNNPMYGRRGKDSPAWQGGIQLYVYGPGFTKQLKEQIRKRDKYSCCICHKTQKQLKRTLSVHHIDYNKNNHDPYNLISLCKRDHTKTNHNRKYWIKYFKRIIHKHIKKAAGSLIEKR